MSEEIIPSAPIVHVLTFEGCPHAEAARRAAREAVSECDRPVELVEVDLLHPELPTDLQGYPSPTVLVNMSDVGSGDGRDEGLSCRAAGAPSTEAIRGALDALWRA